MLQMEFASVVKNYKIYLALHQLHKERSLHTWKGYINVSIVRTHFVQTQRSVDFYKLLSKSILILLSLVKTCVGL